MQKQVNTMENYSDLEQVQGSIQVMVSLLLELIMLESLCLDQLHIPYQTIFMMLVEFQQLYLHTLELSKWEINV